MMYKRLTKEKVMAIIWAIFATALAIAHFVAPQYEQRVLEYQEKANKVVEILYTTGPDDKSGLKDTWSGYLFDESVLSGITYTSFNK